MSTLDTLVQMALKAAKKRPETRHFLIGVAVLRDDGAIVVARNEATREPCEHGHAEAKVLGKSGLNPELVVVARITRDGEWAIAKPCAKCERKLRAIGARRVYYTTATGLELMV